VTPATLAIQFLNGLASASSLFLVAAGLTLIFGVTRIVNFAHGSFYMLGAFVAYSLVTALPRTGLAFWVGVALAALAIGLIGAALEMVILRRIYRAPELFQLLATFGVVLIIQDAALWIWGSEELLGPRVPGLRGAGTECGSHDSWSRRWASLGSCGAMAYGLKPFAWTLASQR